VKLMESRNHPVLSCHQRGLHANALLMRSAAYAGHQTLVAGTRALHLPSASSARSAHPHPT